MPLTPEARDLAIRTVLGEAGGEGPDGMTAVAHVLKNRADSGAWGNPFQGGLTRVINAKGQFASMVGGGKVRSPNDPDYQRAGAIVDAVFNGQTPDNTGGATNFYANRGPNAMAAPDWAKGATNVRQIGNQSFMTVPYTAASTAGTAITGPSSAPPPGASEADAETARHFLALLSAHTDRAGDTANLNPDFAVKMAAAIKQARAEGMPISVMSAYRTPGQTGSAYDAGGNSSHSYGLAVDVAGLDGPNGPITKRWAQIAQANGLSNPYGIGNGAEFNHWQLPPVPLEQTPQMLAQLKAAAATGNFANVWAAYTPTGETPRQGPYQPTGEAASKVADIPAPAAQPVKASAPVGTPPGSAPPPPTTTNPRFQVLTTMGQGGRPGLPYTALNLGPGAGSTPPPAAPAAPATAAASPAARPDLTQRVPLSQTPQPTPRPTPSAIGAYPDSTSYPQFQSPTQPPTPPTPQPPASPTPPPPQPPTSLPHDPVYPQSNPDWSLRPNWLDTINGPNNFLVPQPSKQPPFQTSLSNPVQAFLNSLFQTG